MPQVKNNLFCKHFIIKQLYFQICHQKILLHMFKDHLALMVSTNNLWETGRWEGWQDVLCKKPGKWTFKFLIFYILFLVAGVWCGVRGLQTRLQMLSRPKLEARILSLHTVRWSLIIMLFNVLIFVYLCRDRLGCLWTWARSVIWWLFPWFIANHNVYSSWQS